MTLKYAKLFDTARAPVRKHPTDAGVDVYAFEKTEIPAFNAGKVRTGLTFEVEPGTMLLIKPKSGSDYIIGAGVVDAGYQGEILVKVINYTPTTLQIPKGQALAQLVQVLIRTDELAEYDPENIHQAVSDRGADGGIVRQ